MDAAVSSVLSALEEEASQEASAYAALSPEERRRVLDCLMLTIGPDSGRLINFLIKILRCRRILELGSGIGYSTIWLAEAARYTGGRVKSVEQNLDKLLKAISHSAEAGLLEVAEFLHCDAVEFLESDTCQWDLVLMDLWKEYYIPCFERLRSRLVPGALVVADNVRWPPEVQDVLVRYRQFVRADPEFESIDVDIGNGLELTWKK